MYTEIFVSLKIRSLARGSSLNVFSYPPSYVYYVKATGERFRSFEGDQKKAYQELMQKKTFRTVVIYFAVKICFTTQSSRYPLFFLGMYLTKKPSTLSKLGVAFEFSQGKSGLIKE